MIGINMIKAKATKNTRKIFRHIFLVLFFSAAMVFQTQAYEFSGMTFNLMHSSGTNFYGLGFFTSDKKFSAGFTLLLPTQAYASLMDSDERDKTPDTHLWNRDYPFYSFEFFSQYNFIRATRSSFFVGFSMMPLILTKYMYSFSGGMEFFQSESVRFVFEYKHIFTNYATTSEGKSSHLNRIAQGPTFTFAIKYAFLGSKRKVVTETKKRKKIQSKGPEPKRPPRRKEDITWDQ